MSQHDMDIANQAGALFRADLNLALQALVGNSSGTSAPAVTFPYQFWADASAGLMKMRNAANTAWVSIGLLGVPNFGHILPGAIVYHAKSAAPAGYLRANGGAVSRAVYVDLFNEIGTTFGAGDGSTTFNLPELRSEFIRGWDDSRGIDAGRVFGSGQAMDLQGHLHSLANYTPTGSFSQTGTAVTLAQGAGSFTTTLTGGTETRPRNVALLACIKY